MITNAKKYVTTNSAVSKVDIVPYRVHELILHKFFKNETPGTKSILYSVLPSIMMTSEPRSVRTSSIHLEVWWKELELVISYTTTATVESRM
jgi:hypothetical protein